MLKNEDFKVDFIGIGAARRGTTWIYECLKEHPQICVSKIKEVRFFSDQRTYRKGMKYYQSFFNHCSGNKIKGEISPAYLWGKNGENVASLIKKHFPGVKIFAVLRDPAERAYSHYHYDMYIEQGLYYTKLKNILIYFPKVKS